MENLNNRCKSVKVSYSKTPDEYYKQKLTVLLTKEQLDAYNKIIRSFEVEKMHGVNTHSTLTEGDNALDTNALLRVLSYFSVNTDEQFKPYKRTLVEVSVA